MKSDLEATADAAGPGHQAALHVVAGPLTSVELPADREARLEGSAEIGRQLLTEGVVPVVQRILDLVCELGRARTVSFVGPSSAEDDHFEVTLATGTGAADLLGLSYLKESTLEGRAMLENRALIGTAEQSRCHHAGVEAPEPLGPLLAVPLRGPEDMRGAIVLSRGAGQPAFGSVELGMTQDFARQSSIAFELAHSAAVQEQLQFHETRDAEVRALHDDLIQRLFGLGAMVKTLRHQGPATAGAAQARTTSASWQPVTHEIDAIIRRLRSLLKASPGSFS